MGKHDDRIVVMAAVAGLMEAINHHDSDPEKWRSAMERIIHPDAEDGNYHPRGAFRLFSQANAVEGIHEVSVTPVISGILHNFDPRDGKELNGIFQIQFYELEEPSNLLSRAHARGPALNIGLIMARGKQETEGPEWPFDWSVLKVIAFRDWGTLL